MSGLRWARSQRTSTGATHSNDLQLTGAEVACRWSDMLWFAGDAQRLGWSAGPRGAPTHAGLAWWTCSGHARTREAGGRAARRRTCALHGAAGLGEDTPGRCCAEAGKRLPSPPVASRATPWRVRLVQGASTIPRLQEVPQEYEQTQELPSAAAASHQARAWRGQE